MYKAEVQEASNPHLLVLDGEDDQGRVVGKIGVAKFGDRIEDAHLQSGCSEPTVGDEKVNQPQLAEFLAGRVAGFGDAVGEENQAVTRGQSDFTLLIGAIRKNSEHVAALAQASVRAILAQ